MLDLKTKQILYCPELVAMSGAAWHPTKSDTFVVADIMKGPFLGTIESNTIQLKKLCSDSERILQFPCWDEKGETIGMLYSHPITQPRKVIDGLATYSLSTEEYRPRGSVTTKCWPVWWAGNFWMSDGGRIARMSHDDEGDGEDCL